MDLSTYINWLFSLKEEFLSLMSTLIRLGHNIQKPIKFMILALISLLLDLDTARKKFSLVQKFHH